MCVYITLANIVEDEQIDRLKNLQQVLPVIVKLIGMCADKISQKTKGTRYFYIYFCDKEGDLNINLLKSCTKKNGLAVR